MPESNLSYFCPSWIEPTEVTLDTDICVYGGTAAGVIAAVCAVRRGKSAIVLQPGIHIGGMTTAGSGVTDYCKQHVIGGMPRQFYRDLETFYGREEEEWLFEPDAAEAVLTRYLTDAGVRVIFRQFLDSVSLDDERITAIKMLGGLQVTARIFVDTTYEGDLMAKAGVLYAVGREANSVYGETINGVQTRDKHQFSHAVDPYVVQGDPSSGTLAYVNQQDAAPNGSGDHRIQAYNFRVCTTDDPALRVDWEKPEGYEDFELACRWFAGEMDACTDQLLNYQGRPQNLIKKFDVLTARTSGGFFETDTNSYGLVSSDFTGANYAWPEESFGERGTISQAHAAYQKGLYWFMANDESVPARFREIYAQFGLPKEEFLDTGHCPYQLSVREADTQHHREPDDPVGMASYAMDSHNCQRFVRDGVVLNEGDVQLQPTAPYGVSYRSIISAPGECPNLFEPVCLSASHIAYGSVRMEPVFIS